MALAPPCFFYKCQIRPDGTPVVGTMQGYPTEQISDPCVEALLPPYQMVVPAGKIQCFPDTGLRYFYKLNKQTGQVLSNSLFSRKGKPSSMCTGVYNILEFIIHN